MQYIVTGGAGFIGSHLVDQLCNLGHEVTVIDNFSTGQKENLLQSRAHISIVDYDLSDPTNLNKYFHKNAVVFHLAALADIVPSIQNPEAYFKSNVTATFNVVNAARNAGVKRLIYAASSSCYGIPESYPTPESADVTPQYPYALTKFLGEQIVLHWAQVYSLPALSLRLFNVYGPRCRTTGTYGSVFGVFLAQKLNGHPLTVVGDGTQRRDFTYVSDVVDALILAGQSDITGRIYNVGSGRPIAINELVTLLSSETIMIPKRPGEPDQTHADIRKVSRELGWEPKVSFETGVKHLVKNIKAWNDAPVWTPETIESATSDWFAYLGKGCSD